MDSETLSLAALTETPFEAADRLIKARKFAPQVEGRSVPGGVESLVGRRKDGKEYSYEVKWASHPEKTDWLPRSILEAQLGLGKLVSQFDTVISMKRGGSEFRGLDFKNLKIFFENFGLNSNSVESKISSLSGGQKIRLTIAGAFWVSPHLVILDEPTNYLDSASLDSLLDALSHFPGGVMVISHNSTFMDKFAKEKWIVDNGRMRIE